MPVKLAEGEKLLFEIKTAAATAGKVHMYFAIQAF